MPICCCNATYTPNSWIPTLTVCPNTCKMARNNRQKTKNNKQPSEKPSGKSSNQEHPANATNNQFNNQRANISNPTSKPPQCQICGKLHKGECRYKNPPAQARPTNTCSYCGKKGHDESVCYKKNPNKRQSTPTPTFSAKKSLRIRRDGRWETRLDCQRERDQSAVSFPLTLAGTMATPPMQYGVTSNAWLEDSDHDAIMCLQDCRSGGNFCCKRFAVNCANQLKQSIGPLDRRVTQPEHAAIVISQRDEEGLRQTMFTYGLPSNAFGESSLMDIDEVF